MESNQQPLDLFSYMPPPAKGKTDTSEMAAEKVEDTRRHAWGRIMAALKKEAQTGSELAANLGFDILYLRPRLCELRDYGHIERTAFRRKNQNGNTEIVWALKEIQVAE